MATATMALARFLVYWLTHGGLRTRPIKEVTPIAGATTLDVPGACQAILRSIFQGRSRPQ
jgi:hypothetical protein